MRLEGSIRTTGPAEEVVRGLTRDDILAAIAPEGFEFRKVQKGVADFVIRRSFGPITLTLQGTMTTTTEAEDRFTLEIKAAHLIGGKVAVLLQVNTSAPDEDGLCALAWGGELTAQGLAGRLLTERAEQGNDILRNLFLRLRDKVEDL
jgi:carbon monoxide dehydrogenase subunit G